MGDTRPDMGALLAQHRRTYAIDTSIGRIVLRHLRRLDAERITAHLTDTVSGYARAMQELHELSSIAKFCASAQEAAPMTEAQNQRMLELIAWASPHLDEFAMSCFVQPEVKTREEFEALANALHPDEWEKVQGLLVPLANVSISYGERELAFLNRLKAYGIPLAEDLTGENMTCDQGNALEQAAELEGKALEGLMGGN
jgi:hypothetical protein